MAQISKHALLKYVRVLFLEDVEKKITRLPFYIQ